MDVRMPDGTVVTNVPEGTTPSRLTQKLDAYYARTSGLDKAFAAAHALQPEAQRAKLGRPELRATPPSFLQDVSEGFTSHRVLEENLLKAATRRLSRGKVVDPDKSSSAGRFVPTLAKGSRDVTMPDGTVVTNVPAGVTTEEITAKLALHEPSDPPPSIWDIDDRPGRFVGLLGREALSPLNMMVGSARAPLAIMGSAGINAAAPTMASLAEGRDPSLREALIGGTVGAAGGLLGVGVGKGINRLRRPRVEAPSADVPAHQSAGAQAVTADALDTGFLDSELVGKMTESAKAFGRQVGALQGKSVSVLDEPAKYSETLRGLREKIEHSDLPGRGTGQADFDESVLLKTGRFMPRLNEALSKAKTPEAKDLLRHELLDKSYMPPKGSQAGTATEVRTLLDDVRKYAQTEGGLDIGYVRGYLPRVYDTKALGKPEVGDAFIRKLDEYGVSQEDGDTLLAALVDGGGIATLNPTKPIASEVHRKLSQIPDEELAPFLRTDLNEILPKYVGDVIKRTEYSRIYGPANERLEIDILKIKDESRKSGRKLTAFEEKRIRDLASVQAGTFNKILRPTVNAANDWALTTEYAITLPLSAFANLAEPLIAIERAGFKAFAKAIPPAFDHVAKQIQRTIFGWDIPKAEAARQLEELGLGLDATMAQVMREMMATGGLAAKTQEVFFKANLMAPVTRFTQIIAMKAGEALIRDNLKALARGAGNQRMVRELQELGLDIPLAQDWLKARDQATHMYQPKIQQALLRFVKSTQINPRGTTRPLWMSNPRFKLVSLLKSYFTTAANTIGKRVLWKLVKGDSVEKARVVGMITLLMAGAHFQRLGRDRIVYGEGGNPYTKDLTTGAHMLRAFAGTGLMGPMKNYIESTKHGFGQAEALAGTISVPAGQLLKIWNAAQAEDREKKRLKKELFRTIPIAGVFAPRVFPPKQ